MIVGVLLQLLFCFRSRFVGGKLNMCYNAVDRHVENGRGDQAAVIYDSPVTGTKQVITYREVQEQVKHWKCGHIGNIWQAQQFIFSIV